MCWMCAHPDATRADYLNLIREKIARFGWFVQLVERDRWRPGFAYTVGLTALGHPEILVTGLPYRHAYDFLHGVTEHLVHHDGDPLLPGTHHPYRDHELTEIVAVAQPGVHLVMANELYGSAVRAVQVVYADDRGRWPWEVGFRGKQPVLGSRATAA